MPNKLINIGGEDRPVNFGRNFWGEVEDITEESLSLILRNWQYKIGSFKFQTAITFSALKWGLYDPKKGNEPNPSFTMFQVADWIEVDLSVMAKVWEALGDSMPKKENAQEEKPPQ